MSDVSNAQVEVAFRTFRFHDGGGREAMRAALEAALPASQDEPDEPDECDYCDARNAQDKRCSGCPRPSPVQQDEPEDADLRAVVEDALNDRLLGTVPAIARQVAGDTWTASDPGWREDKPIQVVYRCLAAAWAVAARQDEPEAQEPCACCDGLGWETVVCLECGAVPVQQDEPECCQSRSPVTGAQCNWDHPYERTLHKHRSDDGEAWREPVPVQQDEPEGVCAFPNCSCTENRCPGVGGEPCRGCGVPTGVGAYHHIGCRTPEPNPVPVQQDELQITPNDSKDLELGPVQQDEPEDDHWHWLDDRTGRIYHEGDVFGVRSGRDVTLHRLRCTCDPVPEWIVDNAEAKGCDLSPDVAPLPRTRPPRSHRDDESLRRWEARHPSVRFRQSDLEQRSQSTTLERGDGTMSENLRNDGVCAAPNCDCISPCPGVPDDRALVAERDYLRAVVNGVHSALSRTPYPAGGPTVMTDAPLRKAVADDRVRLLASLRLQLAATAPWRVCKRKQLEFAIREMGR